MSETAVYYTLSSRGRLESLELAILTERQKGNPSGKLDQLVAEARVEAARVAGEEALAAGQETVVIDGLEVPSAFAALVRQMEGVTQDHILDIATAFTSEADFVAAMDAAQEGGAIDPRFDLLRYRWVEVHPRNDVHLPGADATLTVE